MRTFLLVGMIALSGSVVANGSPPADEGTNLVTQQTPDGEMVGWKSFHEVEGTKTGDVWKLQPDGVLVCKGNPRGYLYTTKEYTDVVLSFEWRWPPDGQPGNGGVLLRTTGEDKIWPKSLEAQLNAGHAGDFWGLAGYTLKGPEDRMKVIEHDQFGRLTNVKHMKALENPLGQWNHCRVALKGSTISVSINHHCDNQARHCDKHPGRILLTSEGSEIHFRNIRLIEGE